MDRRFPFVGSQAIRSNRTTRGRLAGPTLQRLGPDVYADASLPRTLALRTRGVALWMPDGVIGGYAAAELLGAPCAPEDAAVDVVVGRRRVRCPAGVVVHQDLLGDGDVIDVDGILVTGPLRTAYDLARRLDHVEAVVAVDALCHRWRLDPSELLEYPALRTNPRGARRLERVVADADRRAESPPETRLRLLLPGAGIPTPTPQHSVHDVTGRFVGRLDFAWPELRIGLEYQGDHHRTDRRQYAKDAVRFAELAAAGWLILPVTAYDVYHDPAALLARIRRAIASRRAGLRMP